MKHLILVIAVLACSAQAQQPARCLELHKVKVVGHLLHQWGETRAELTFKARNCHIVEGRERTNVTFESKPGLYVEVRSVGFRHLDEESIGTATVKAGEMSISLKLSAASSLPVGENTLHGMVNYQVVDQAGTITPETLAIDVPFKVAPPELYKSPAESSGFMQGVKQTGVVVLEAIIIVPALLFMLIYCPISGECPTC